MTERLRDGMRNRLKTPHHPWGKSMVVLGGMESRSRPEVTHPDGRTDIPILLIQVFQRLGEHDPHAIIECKRIAGSDTHLCREYVVEGVDRFCTGKYAHNHARGFMVGYVIAGTCDEAVAGVNAYLKRVKRESEWLKKMPAPRDVNWESRHPRTNGSSIDLHHAFVPVLSASNN